MITSILLLILYCLSYNALQMQLFKVILYSYLILKKMNERITDS